LFAAATSGFSDGLRAALVAGAVVCAAGAVVVILLGTTGRQAGSSA
jgi:hypothetical protein